MRALTGSTDIFAPEDAVNEILSEVQDDMTALAEDAKDTSSQGRSCSPPDWAFGVDTLTKRTATVTASTDSTPVSVARVSATRHHASDGDNTEPEPFVAPVEFRTSVNRCQRPCWPRRFQATRWLFPSHEGSMLSSVPWSVLCIVREYHCLVGGTPQHRNHGSGEWCAIDDAGPPRPLVLPGSPHRRQLRRRKRQQRIPRTCR